MLTKKKTQREERSSIVIARSEVALSLRGVKRRSNLINIIATGK
jgi:hypothetical protein